VNKGLPPYRFLVPPSTEPSAQIHRASSDSILRHFKSPGTHNTGQFKYSERGVHGGEYSVRPNMQESMIFLKKLFTQQQLEGGNPLGPGQLFSPPDGPMCKF
jgi:hypothetical protein